MVIILIITVFTEALAYNVIINYHCFHGSFSMIVFQYCNCHTILCLFAQLQAFLCNTFSTMIGLKNTKLRSFFLQLKLQILCWNIAAVLATYQPFPYHQLLLSLIYYLLMRTGIYDNSEWIIK